MRSRSRVKTAVVAVGVAFSLAFGALAVRDVDLRVFWEGITQMKYGWLAPSLAGLALTIWLRAARWRLLFTPASRPPFAAAARALTIGLLFNQILPLRAGEAARVLALNHEAGTSRAEALGTAFVERIYDVLALLAILFVAWPFLPPISWIRGAAIFGIVFLALTAAGVVVLVRFGARPLQLGLRPVARLPGLSRDRTDAAAASVAGGLSALHRPGAVLAAGAVTLAFWFIAGLSYWAVLIGFNLHTGLGAALLVLVATNLALVIPSLPAGVGVFEAAAIFALKSYGIGESRALACAVVLHAVNFFPYLIAGLYALHTQAALQRARARTAADGYSTPSGSGT